jgi:hypothetical protein
MPVLVSAYIKNKGLLEGTKIPHNVKNKIWEAIALQVSEAGTAQRTTKEVKTKWLNMSRISKHTHSAFSAFIERRLSLLVLFVVF